MHLNVFLRYLLGTNMYLDSFGYLQIFTGSVGAEKGPRIEHFCYFCHFSSYFWCLLKSPCIQCIQMFARGTHQVLACIFTVFGYFQIHVRLWGPPKGPRIVHLYPKEGHWPRTYSITRSSESGRSKSGSEGVGDQPEGLKGQQED